MLAIMLNLDVTVRLLDQLSAPSRRTAEALDRLAGTARKLTSLPNASRDLRGLSTALRGFSEASAGGEATAGRVTRLANAVTGLAREAGGIRQAATAVAGMSRSISRLAAVSDKADKAAAGVKALKGAFAGFPTAGGFVADTNTALRDMLALQHQAITNARTLAGAGGGRGGRRGMGGGSGGPGSGAPAAHGFGGDRALAYNGSALLDVTHKAIEVSITAEDAILRARLNGFTEEQISKIKATAAKVADDNHATTYAGNVKGLIEARLALAGDLDKAARLFPMAANFGVIFAKMSGETDKAEAATKGIYAAFRGGEIRNVVGDETRLASLFRAMMASSIVSEGKIGPQQFASNIQYARSSGLALDDKFTNFTLPFLMQELTNAGKGSRGGQAGNALMSGYAAIVQGRIAHPQEFVDAGELDASDLDKKGKLKPGAKVKDQDLYMADPAEFFRKIMANFEARGITSQNDKLAHLSKMFDNRVAAGLADLLSLQDSRIKAAGEMYRQAGGDTPGSELAKIAAINATLGQSTENLKNAYGDLLVTINGSFVGALTGATQGLNGLAKGAQGLLSRFTGIGSDPNDPNSTGTNYKHVALAGGSVGLAAAAFIARFPAAAVLLGQGFIAYTSGILPAILGRSTLKATADGVAGALTTTNAIGAMKGMGKGLVLGIVEQAAEWGIGKAVDAVQPAFASPERAYRARKFQEQGVLQRFGLFGGSSDPMDPRFAPPEGTPFDSSLDGRRARVPGAPVAAADMKGFLQPPTIALPLAGARAAGGPVGAGLHYLVGEHGPEIFSPARSGGITTNTVLGRLTGGEDGEIPKSIRYLQFALTSAVDGIARAVDRMSRGNVVYGGADGSDDVSGAGTGSHISGGRRGFAERAGHFGGRRGFATRQFGTKDESLPDSASTGPHVRLGKMGSAAAGRYAKFDSKAPAITGALMSKYGLTREQASGVVGNLGHESARFTAYHEGGQAPGKGGVGWAQWTGPRRRAFERWTSARHLDPTSDDASWRFLTEGDPETAKAIAAVKKESTVEGSTKAFEASFERAGVKAYASRFALAHRAYGLHPVAGVTDPADVAARKPTPADTIPDVLRDQPARRASEKTVDAGQAAKAGAGGGHTTIHNTFHVHPGPGHDERKIADAVHRKFNNAAQAQYNDGVFA